MKAKKLTDYQTGTPCAQQDRTPVVEITGKRFSLNMISTVSVRGEFLLCCTRRPRRLCGRHFREYRHAFFHMSFLFPGAIVREPVTRPIPSAFQAVSRRATLQLRKSPGRMGAPRHIGLTSRDSGNICPLRAFGRRSVLHSTSYRFRV
jgi:hypothetical protein